MAARTHYRIRLTDDEITWLIRAHRDRAAEVLMWAPVTPGARRLAAEAMTHHETRIALLKGAQAGRRYVVGEA
jgi:hypothetical protein